MSERYVLCRRDLSDIGQPKKYCAKPIKKQNALGWCEGCYSRVPFWPVDGRMDPAIVVESEDSGR